ncbi:MAG TPA: DUF6036 family nucleotidyltransferase [Xanthomonadales bacterium]|nr:DUF6036 family nucleotidyltransferase [Xanthomonadales bacterium]
MNQYLTEEITTFIQTTDNEVSARYRLLIIGGAAAALAYHVSRATTDIDTIGEVPEALRIAFERAKQKTGIFIPVTPVGVFDAPYNYETRLVPLSQLNLRNLEIVVPERHDLALMKTVRGYENDFQAISDMHQQEPLSSEILLDRYLNEMGHEIGRPGMIDLNFISLVQILFGEAEKEKVEAAINKKKAENK